MFFKSKNLYISWHSDMLPWLKIFTNHPYKELSECPTEVKLDLFTALDICEKEMIRYFSPDKINIASFGNYLPHLHFHIIARFKNDDFFPESTWGVKQRTSDLILPDFKPFELNLIASLQKELN